MHFDVGKPFNPENHQDHSNSDQDKGKNAKMEFREKFQTI